eukprot:CAMPEP_0115007436 /NCGR_PEP_ID=MMETSP0216-20121206/21181_1 /TAXON_ID=223996 /ORGANISM="Protocruzia adherens, Strain Boccale" /LENGTH=115 /DNA_ID=CAMNT_0002374383 /DNA_START=56 /DNA_END=403 /DNA_ORIENTATION=+
MKYLFSLFLMFALALKITQCEFLPNNEGTQGRTLEQVKDIDAQTIAIGLGRRSLQCQFDLAEGNATEEQCRGLERMAEFGRVLATGDPLQICIHHCLASGEYGYIECYFLCLASN